MVAEEVSDAIHQGLNATNQLRVVCEGDRFDFYVNWLRLRQPYCKSLKAVQPRATLHLGPDRV
jgi:hypothetical protein